jgi:hypothetical protein
MLLFVVVVVVVVFFFKKNSVVLLPFEMSVQKRDRDEAVVVQAEEKDAKLDEEQTRLDDVLISACRSGSLSAIEAAL